MQSGLPKTLIILSPGFPENEADSTCIPPQQVFVLALQAVNPGLEIIVLALTYPFVSGEYEWNGIRVIAFGGKRKGRLFRMAAGIRMWRALVRLNKETEVTGLLSFWLGKCAFIGHKFAKRNHLKHYSWLLGQDARPGNVFVNRVRPEGSSLIAISDFIARGLHTHYGIMPEHVIPVGIDKELFERSEQVRDIDVLGAGSLIPLKQYAVFLELIKCMKYFRRILKR